MILYDFYFSARQQRLQGNYSKVTINGETHYYTEMVEHGYAPIVGGDFLGTTTNDNVEIDWDDDFI